MDETTKMIWSLWPDMRAMARKTGIPLERLREIRAQGGIPGPEHDFRHLERARFSGMSLTREMIEEARRKGPPADVSDFVRRMGGTGVVARQCGVKQATVRSWKTRGRIPERYRFRLGVIAERRGVPNPGALYLKEEEDGE